jgi:hypothetical protein
MSDLPTNEPGVWKHLPFKDYLALPGVSKHELDLVSKSPAHYQESKVNPPETTPAMAFGTAAHAWILEPDTAAEQVVVAPSCDRRTKAGKEAWAEFQTIAGNKTVVSQEDANHLAKMSAAVNAHPIARTLLNAATGTEVSVQWQDERTESLCRCRPDLMTPDFIVDLKTTYDASEEAFSKTVYKYRYHVQAAYYLDGCKSHNLVSPDATFLFVAVERKPPYGVAIYALPKDDLDRGRYQYERDLTRYAHCMKTGHWFGYTETINYIQLPTYARNHIDQLTGNE